MKSSTIAGLVLGIAILTMAIPGFAQTHAPWPSDWNNWFDPNLWVTVGNPGNAPDTRYDANGFGAVSYTYKMGKFEVTAGQYTGFLNAVGKTDTYGLYDTSMWSSSYGCEIQQSGSPGSYTYSVDPNWANRAVNCVSWGDAARFCNWLTHCQPSGAQDANTTEDGSYYLNGVTTNDLLAVTRRTAAEGGRYYIPTEDEWYKAAYHKNDGATGNYSDYPTGSDSIPSNEVLTTDGGNNANFWALTWIGGPYYRTLAGDFENSESPYGTFDQGGNVAEWNEAILESSCRAVRGGSFSNGYNLLSGGGREGYGPMLTSVDVGFRVVEIPEPATLSLLALAGLAVLRRRRK